MSHLPALFASETALSAGALGLAFLAYVALVGAVVAATLVRRLPRRAALTGLAALLVWLAYAGAIGYSGILSDPTMRPPGMAILVAPILTCLVGWVGVGSFGRLLVLHVPLSLILLLQSFRVGVEVVLHLLWQAGQVPHLMTLEGGNVEIIVALTAPLLAWMTMRGQHRSALVWLWNIAGLLSLLNVVARAVLTAPGPLNLIHAEVPNLAMAQFPFSFIPGFMVPLALILHVLAFRAMRTSRS
jgi:hypothetical protein